MTKEEVSKRIIDACVRQIDTSFYGSSGFTVVVDDLDGSDGATTVEIEGTFCEEYGEVSFYGIRVFSEDHDGNEITTEVAKLIGGIDFYREIQNKVTRYLCPAV